MEEQKLLIENKVTKYLELTQQIKQQQKNIKIHKDAKKIIEAELIKFMRENDIPQFQFKEGQLLKLTEKTSKTSIKETWIQEKLSKIDEQKDIVDYINTLKQEITDRESKVNFGLKHVNK